MYEEEKYIRICIYIVYTCPHILREPQDYQTSNMCPERVLIVDNILFPLLTIPSLFMLIFSVRKKRHLTIDNKVFSRNIFVPSLTFPSLI